GAAQRRPARGERDDPRQLRHVGHPQPDLRARQHGGPRPARAAHRGRAGELTDPHAWTGPASPVSRARWVRWPAGPLLGESAAMGNDAMSEEEWRAFIRSPVRPAVLSTARADGRPHVAPVWYDLDGDLVVFNTGPESVK